MKKEINYRPLDGCNKPKMFDARKIVKAIKFSVNDLNIAHARQRKAGYLNFSTFGRDCILNTEIVERVTPEQMRILNELIRERNNLNQIAKACNAGRCWSVANEASALIRKMDAVISFSTKTKTKI